MLRAAVLVALLGSSALTIDYLSPVPSFCGASGGCSVVRQSSFAYLGAAHIPLPALGLFSFTVVLTLSLLPGKRRRAAAPVAIVGGLVAAALIVLQWVAVGAFCSLCLTVDGAALLAAGAAVVFLRSPAHPETGDAAAASGAWWEPLRDSAWIGLGVIAVTAPLAWVSVKPLPDVPREIAAYYEPGKINVVEFVDFQCPFCRLYQPELAKVAAEFGDRVHLVRIDLPLTIHPLARDAARAHVCAEERGKGEAMASALFATEDLTLKGVLAAGKSVGLDPQALERCMKLPETDRKVSYGEELLTRLHLLQGLPTTFVGAKMIVGAVEQPALREAFEQALEGANHGLPAPAYFGIVLALAGLVLWFGRNQRPAPRGGSAAAV